MSEVPAGQAVSSLPLHATWWMVLKPRMVVLANGQPAFDAVGQFETLAEATGTVRNIPGGVIVANLVVFVNPAAAPPSAILRRQ